MKQILKPWLMIALTMLIVGFSCCWARPVLAVDLKVDSDNGTQVFNLHCAGCHINGGNIIRRGKNLKLKTLQRNKVDSVAAIAQIVTNGRGIMSAYGDRLTPAEIQAVSSYVLEQAEQGWKK